MKKVKIEVDMSRRNKLRRLHTATHIVNFSARQVLGNHIWQHGSNLKPEFGTLDITHYKKVSQDELQQIEKLANKVIFENRKVNIEEVPRTEAEKKYGFTVYQGGAIPMKSIRIIKVFDNDIEACGGIHMEETGGIGLIKILEAQKIQDGVVRLKFVVEEFAIDEVHKKEKIIESLKELYSVEAEKLASTSEKFFNEWKEQKKEIERYKAKLKDTYADMISQSKEKEFTINEDFDMGLATELFNVATKTKKSFRLNTEKFIVATNDIKVENTKKAIDKGSFKIYIK